VIYFAYCDFLGIKLEGVQNCEALLAHDEIGSQNIQLGSMTHTLALEVKNHQLRRSSSELSNYSCSEALRLVYLGGSDAISSPPYMQQNEP
jgi:hypothetical protein